MHLSTLQGGARWLPARTMSATRAWGATFAWAGWPHATVCSRTHRRHSCTKIYPVQSKRHKKNYLYVRTRERGSSWWHRVEWCRGRHFPLATHPHAVLRCRGRQRNSTGDTLLEAKNFWPANNAAQRQHALHHSHLDGLDEALPAHHPVAAGECLHRGSRIYANNTLKS